MGELQPAMLCCPQGPKRAAARRRMFQVRRAIKTCWFKYEINGTSSINHDSHGTWEYSLEENGGVFYGSVGTMPFAWQFFVAYNLTRTRPEDNVI